MISTTVVWIGEQGWLEALMVSEGFTGMIIDTLDRRRWYEDGRQVARARLKDVASTEAAGQAYVRKLVAEPDILERARKDYGAGEGRTVMTAMSALNESQLADIAGKLGVSISGSRAAMLSSVRQSLLPQMEVPPLMPLRIGMTPERARTSDTSEESEEKARISAGAVLTPEAVLAELRTPQLKGQHELALLTANAGKALGVDAFDAGKFEAEQVRLLARTRAVFADPKNFDYDAMMELIDTPNAFAAAKTTDPEEVSKKIAAITGDNGDQPGFKVTHAWWEDDGFKKRMGEARGIVSRLYPGLKDLSVVMGSHPTEYSSITPTRIVTDSAQGNGPKWGGHIGTIVTMNADNAMTVRSMVHELMHAVEVHRPELLARSIAFRNERNSVNPRPPGYLAGTINSQEADVLTWSDEFAKGIPPIRAGYIGKNYGLIATEVQSVGMEQMISGGAAGLFQRDPEYAAFLLSQMRTPAAARWVGNSHHTEPFYEQLDKATRTKYASVFCRQEDIAAFMKLHGERDAEAKRQYEVGRDAKARMREQEAKKALKESVVFIGGDERLREFFVREGFSGIIVDSLNRKQHYRNGKTEGEL